MSSSTPEKNRDRLVSLRLSAGEYRVAAERAVSSGKSVSQVLRDGLTGNVAVTRSMPQQTFVNGAMHSSIANVGWSIA